MVMSKKLHLDIRVKSTGCSESLIYMCYKPVKRPISNQYSVSLNISQSFTPFTAGATCIPWSMAALRTSTGQSSPAVVVRRDKPPNQFPPFNNVLRICDSAVVNLRIRSKFRPLSLQDLNHECGLYVSYASLCLLSFLVHVHTYPHTYPTPEASSVACGRSPDYQDVQHRTTT